MQQLKDKHPTLKLVLLTAPDGQEVVVRKPDRMMYRRYRGQMMDEGRRADANEIFLRQCTVYPSEAELEAMIDDAPGLADTFSGKLLKVAGLAGEDKVEKKAL